METSSNRRARLRHELQQAHDVWMTASEWPLSAAGTVDTSGASDITRGQWQAYLAAKQRLVHAWAEEPRTI